MKVGDEIVVRLRMGDRETVMGYRRGTIGKLYDGTWPEGGDYFAWIEFATPSFGAWFERESLSPWSDSPAEWRFGE
jgi:hypothetical protein